MHMAMTEPIIHAHTAVPGPPSVRGTPIVAGTEPRTPSMEIAYETMDHFWNSLLSSCKA
jgi:hypothetical protein